MPYIKSDKRVMLDNELAAFPEDAGELNYCITRMCLDFLARKGKRYATINEIVGALDCAKLEFYRRLAAPYEDTKIAENGDVAGYETLPRG